MALGLKGYKGAYFFEDDKFTEDPIMFTNEAIEALQGGKLYGSMPIDNKFEITSNSIHKRE
jgi:hypothetical protein